MDLVSIIVPVYNAEKSLKRCIESILNQTYSNIELVLIDDGSKDKSGKICDEYAQKDRRINVIHKMNGGVSSARNLGMDNATGKYFLFVDSDDWIPQNTVELHMNAMNMYSVEITSASYEIRGVRRGSKTKYETRLVNLYDSNIDCGSIILDLNSVTRNLYMSDIIKKNHIYFPIEIKYGEDTFFSWSYLRYCEHVYVMEDIGYYVDRAYDDSASYKYYEDIAVWSCKNLDLFRELIHKFGTSDENTIDSFEICLLMFFSCTVSSIMKLGGKNKKFRKKLKIKESIESFESYIAFCENYKKCHKCFKDRLIYTRNADFIYDAYIKKENENRLKKQFRKFILTILSPIIDKKRFFA